MFDIQETADYRNTSRSTADFNNNDNLNTITDTLSTVDGLSVLQRKVFFYLVVLCLKK